MTVEDLIQRFRELQKGHRVDSGFVRGVTACIRVLMDEWEGQEVPDTNVGNTCEDAISRKDTLDWLKQVTVTEGITFETGFKQILTDIRNMPSVESKANWIPVSERLPDKYGEYLITWTTSQSKRPFISICEGECSGLFDYEHGGFKFEWLLEDYIKAYSDVKVIAWMPLPECYRGDANEM